MRFADHVGNDRDDRGATTAAARLLDVPFALHPAKLAFFFGTHTPAQGLWRFWTAMIPLRSYVRPLQRETLLLRLNVMH